MKYLSTVIFLMCLNAYSATFSEFYVQTTGDNLNAGSTTDDAAIFTGTTGFWTNSTGWWKATGAVDLSLVSVGMWASVYTNDCVTNAVFVGRITGVSDADNTVTVSLTAKSGTAPPADVVGTTAIKVGGAWKGPNISFGAPTNSIVFPFGFVERSMTNDGGYVPCINIKSGTYALTNAATHANAGPVWWSGYLTNPRDGLAKPIFDGTFAGGSFTMLTVSGADHLFNDLIFATNGASGNSSLVNNTGIENIWNRCVFRGSRGGGLILFTYNTAIECEFYLCGQGNGANTAGLTTGSSGCTAIRCVSHDNYGANISGFDSTESFFILHCIAYNNGLNGIRIRSALNGLVFASDCYSNVNAGIDISTSAGVGSPVYIENCNFTKNKGFGIDSSGGTNHIGYIVNCGFGTGTATNLGGNISPNFLTAGANGVVTNNFILYAADSEPWTDASVGNFSISLSAAKAMGRGAFLLYTTNSPTVAYPDIGAAQSASTNAAAAGTSAHTFAQ